MHLWGKDELDSGDFEVVQVLDMCKLEAGVDYFVQIF